MAMIQFDYDTILKDLTDRLAEKMGGTFIGGSSATRILEIISEKLAQIARYTEYLTRESKWSLAQNPSSILSQLELFGYDPHRKVGATGTVRVSTDPNFNSTYPYEIVIPKFSRFSNGEFTFCTLEEKRLTLTDTFIDLAVVQGDYMEESFTGADLNNRRYTINNDSTENNLYELLRDSLVCEEVQAFGDSQIIYNGQTLSGNKSTEQSSIQYEYRVRNTSGFSGIELQFSSSDSIPDTTQYLFKYLITSGVEGNVPTIGSVTTVLDSFTDSRGVTVQLYCSNVTSLTGGESYETIDEMRENAPLSFNRVNTAITKNDYTYAINEVTGSSTFYIWTEEEVNALNSQDYGYYDFINNCRIFICGGNYDNNRTLTPWSYAEFTAINEALANRKGMTDYFVLEDPIVVYFYLTGEVFFNRNLTDYNQVTSDITDYLKDVYNVKTAEFYKNLYHSQYTGIFYSRSDIDHVDLGIVLYEKYETTTSNWNGLNESENPPTISASPIGLFGFNEVKDGKYFVTLYNRNTRSLIKDLGYITENGEYYRLYDGDEIKIDSGGQTIQIVPRANSEGFYGIIYRGVSLSSYPELYLLFGQQDEDGAFINDTDRLSESDVGLVLRFIPPKGEDAVLVSPRQILTLTDCDKVTNVWDEEKSGVSSNDTENRMVFTEVYVQ